MHAHKTKNHREIVQTLDSLGVSSSPSLPAISLYSFQEQEEKKKIQSKILKKHRKRLIDLNFDFSRIICSGTCTGASICFFSLA